MREIKFRAKKLSSNEGVYGHYVFMGVYGDKPVHRIIWQDQNNVEYNVIVDPKTVGQYTGLKDRNRREIYEGDIVCFKAWKGKQKGMVKWNDDACGFEIEMSPTSHTGFFHDPLLTCEVIGNIYANPELLN